VALVTLGNPTSIYLDANAVIRFIEGENDGLIFLLESSAIDPLHLYTSELTLAEVLVGPLKRGQQKLVGLYEAFLISDDTLTVVPVDRAVLRASAEVRAILGNKGPDAIHVATAVRAACSVFISSDDRIKLPDGIKQVRIDDIANRDAWV
jgi:predicted nucleic acid-binding protein